jgi:hypothetical protein
MIIGGTWGIALGLIALTGFTALFLILSMRISQSVSEIGRISRRASTLRTVEKHPALQAGDEDDRSAQRMTAAIEILDQVNPRRAETESENLTPDLSDGPLVTVVIPCFNEERFVGFALQSILEQSFANWECIVVDDASTDLSLREIWRVARSDDRFRVLRHRSNGGLSASRNTGLRAARGRYVTFLDADDLLMNDSLMDRVITLSNAADDEHVLGSYCGVRVSPEEVRLEDLPRRMKFESGQIVDFVSADSECPFNAHAPLLVVDRLRALGGFNERMRAGAEDWDLWYRAMRNGYVFVPSKYTTAVYRQKRRSMVRTMPDGHMAEADRLIEAAHRVADPSIMSAPTPTPLSMPIGRYQALLHRADRAVRFASMALVAGDQDAAIRALGVFEEVPLRLVERHVDLGNLGRRGLMRALAISPRELSSIQSLSQPVFDDLHRLISDISSRYETEALPEVRAPHVKALLVPHHAGQSQAMLQNASDRGLGPSDLGVLDIEREGGVQGVSAELPSEIARWSLNEWSLFRGSCDLVMVGEVRIGVVDLLAQAAAASGSQVVEVAQMNADAMRLPEAHRHPLPSGDTRISSIGAGLVGLTPNTLDGEPTGAWQVEEYPETVADAPVLASFRDRHVGERVVIIGNGPSLNQLDLSLLKSEFTIAVNGIFYAADQMGFAPSYYVVEDTAVMRDNLQQIIDYEAGHKFFPSIYRPMVGDHPNVSYFMMNRGFYEPTSPDFCVPRFSTDAAHHMFSGQSVTLINLQLAYYLGFQEVVLIGMDFSYTIPPDAVVEGDVITSASADPNHFHPDYFGPGKVWKDPKLDRVLANYALAKTIYEADGRRIVNATAGGQLELFERVGYSDLIR